MTRWARTTAEVADLAAALAGARAIALDTESDSLHHHKEKVCLVQLASDSGLAALVDPLAGADLAPLGPLLADPAVAKILHGADYDVTTLKRDFGFGFAGLFDTMIASRMLGLPNIGLQAVAAAELGIALSKDSQKDDWSKRPLTPTQERYALADVEHLLALHGRLVAKLEAAGRLSWVREESDAVAELPAARRDRDVDAWQRVKGVRRLTRRQQAVLRAAYDWREAIARETDIPVLQDLVHRGAPGRGGEGPRDPGRAAGDPRRGAVALLVARARAAGRHPRGGGPPRGRAAADAQHAAAPGSLRGRQGAGGRPQEVADRGSRAPRRRRVRGAAAAAAGAGSGATARPSGRPAAIEGFRRWRVAEFGSALVQATTSAQRTIL